MADEQLSPVIGQIVQALAAGNQNMSALIQAVGNLSRFSIGTIAWTAAASVTVADVNVTATSYIGFSPTSASAGTLIAGATSPYVSALTVGMSLTLTTSNAGATAGTETFVYILINPTV